MGIPASVTPLTSGDGSSSGRREIVAPWSEVLGSRPRNGFGTSVFKYAVPYPSWAVLRASRFWLTASRIRQQDFAGQLLLESGGELMNEWKGAIGIGEANRLPQQRTQPQRAARGFDQTRGERIV